MKLSFREIEPFAKKPPPAALAVLVYGPDEGLVRERLNLLTKSVVPDISDPFNVAEFSGEALLASTSLLLDEAKSVSMMGGRRVVRVRAASDKISKIAEETLKALKDGDNFVLIEAGELGPNSALRKLFENAKNAAALPCYVDDERDISRVLMESIRAGGYGIEADALTYMAENVVGDRAVARGEAEKLIIYMGSEKRPISLEDVSACIGDSASLPMDTLPRHVASGRFAEADRVLSLAMAEGVFAVTILRVLQNYYLRLHMIKARLQAGADMESALKALRPPLFFKNKDAFVAQVSALSLQQLEQSLNVIVSAEARCKQSGAVPELVAGRAILALCQIASRAASRRRA